MKPVNFLRRTIVLLLCALILANGPASAALAETQSSQQAVKTTITGSWPDIRITKVKVVANKKIRIDWKKSKDADGYVLFQKVNGKWKKKQFFNTNTITHFYVGGIKKNKKYTFNVVPAKINESDKFVWPAGGTGSKKTVKLKKVTVAMKKGNYKRGSVYGPRLTTKKLKQVKKAVQKFNDKYITTDMSALEKVIVAQAYMNKYCTYAATWAKNGANTAWGSLVYKNKKGIHEAQCSGYARGFKALMDSVGVPCKYIHANKKSYNPSHQWTIVKLSGKWYVLDPQLNSSSGEIYIYGRRSYMGSFGMKWNNSSKVTANDFPYEKIYRTAYNSISVQLALYKMSKE